MPDAPSSHRWFRRFMAVCAMVVALMGLHWWNGPIRPLYFSASEVEDSYEGGGFTGDFARCIRARCTEEFFHKYAQQQGLTEKVVGKLPKGCPGWSISPRTSWWTPPRKLEGAYFTYVKGGERRLMAYHKGVLYYDISVW